MMSDDINIRQMFIFENKRIRIYINELNDPTTANFRIG